MYKEWREKEFLSPLVQGTIAIHLDTFKLKDFALTRLSKLWGHRFKIIEGEVNSMNDVGDCVNVDVDGNIHTFDYVIDCRGFPKDFTDDYVTFEQDFVNHALIHNVDGGADWQYTGHKATECGWMFEIPLTTRKSYGMIFNDNVTSVDEAKQILAKEIDVSVDEIQNIEYKFRSFFIRNLITGRIIKNGNRAAFFEPLFANSLWIYSLINSLVTNHITNKNTKEDVNLEFKKSMIELRDVMAYHYVGGSLYDTPFWQRAKEISTDRLKDSISFKIISERMRKAAEAKDLHSMGNIAWTYTSYHLMVLDDNLGYNFFGSNDFWSLK